MPDLVQPQNTIAVLQKYEFRFQKKYGQNFLIDSHVLSRILETADVKKTDYVLEIGPGIGTMTQALCEAAREVGAVEIDARLIPILEDTLSAYANVTLINEDILKVDLKRLSEEKNGGAPIKVIANLPYYITTPILMTLLESGVPISSITAMMQKEVAERLAASPGTKDYGALSLVVQYYTKPELAANVPPNCFLPRPGVGSAVMHLDLRKEPPVEVKDEKQMFRLIRASFNQRRKTLQNGIANSPDFSLNREEVAQCMLSCRLSPTIRGETLTLQEFAALSDAVTLYMEHKKENG